MRPFVHDAKRFLLKNRSIIEEAPLQIYASALEFSPNRSLIKALYANHIKSYPQINDDWGSNLQVLEGHSGTVYAVAFSPNGQLIASASGDDTVRLWNPAPGVVHQTLESHLDVVNSVVFSPNGQLVASASNESTATVWNPATGDCAPDLRRSLRQGFRGSFSPDGELIASTSNDRTVRLWNIVIGVVHLTLNSRSDWVCAVNFSPDGQLVASASDDETVRLWNPTTGVVRQTLKGLLQDDPSRVVCVCVRSISPSRYSCTAVFYSFFLLIVRLRYS